MAHSKINLMQHPLRQDIYAEIHSRPFPIINNSVEAIHFALLTSQAEAQEQIDLLSQLALQYQVVKPEAKSNRYYAKLKNYEIRWEKHQEFCSLTFIQDVKTPQPFADNFLNDEQINLLDQLPGELVVALRVHLERDKNQPETKELPALFEEHQLYGSTIVGDRATMWSSFRLHSDDYARMLIYDKDLSDYQAGRTLQRVIEIENYRTLSLLSLQPARTLIPKISKLRNKLTVLIKEMQSTVFDDSSEHQLLEQLSKYAAKIEDYRSATAHRFSATEAYYELVEQRLKDLRENSWPGFSSWNKMLQRRLIPGVETCASVNEQLHSLSEHAERASNLLRTRVDINIATQNQKLLQSLNRRSELQLRLQQTVEGLSVVAISYYLVSLIKLVAEGVAKTGIDLNPSIVAAVSSVPVIILTTFFIHRMRHKINKQDSL